MEALRLGFGMLFFGCLLLGVAHIVREIMREGIPQEEIDCEARQLITDYGGDALSVAQGNVMRSQWAKGKRDKIERSRRVLKAVEKSAELHQRSVPSLLSSSL